MQFSELIQNKPVLQAIQDCQYTDTTEIQEKAIPLILEGNDVIGISQTGTGKTAAYMLPLIANIQDASQTQVLILCPTRELCMQIAEECRKFTKYRSDITTVACYGGQPIEKQLQSLKKGRTMIVGTPGRVLDHIQKKTLHFYQLSTLVLDEADEMLNMGFIKEIETVISYLPEHRQTLLFSATMPKAILQLSRTFMHHPSQVRVLPQLMTAATITQEYYEVNVHQKKELLIQLLQMHRPLCAIIFCNTKRYVDEIIAFLVDKKYKAAAIHGDMSQEARTYVMERFRHKHIQLLVASDVVARGIDVEAIDLVINMDIPKEMEYYIHRIGRTGRIGNQGRAITIITNKSNDQLENLEKLIKQPLSKRELPTAKELMIAQQGILQDFVRHEKIQEETRMMYEKLRTDNDMEAITLALLQQEISRHALQPLSILQEAKKPSKDVKMSSLRISLGKQNQVAPAHLVSAIADAANISGKQIGKIKISAAYSIVQVPEEKLHDIMNALRNITICGQAFQCTVVSNHHVNL